NQQGIDYVQEHKRIVDGTRQTIASNSLVIVAHTKSKVQLSKIEDLTQKDFRYFSMANPEAVPAGKYAKAYFESQKIWQQLVPKIAPSTNVRAALAMVESDPSVIGVVYKTDAATSKKTKIIFEIPADQMPHIEYSAAQIKRKKGEIKHNHFLRFLSNPKAQKIFAAHGFQPIAPSS
ncbi:MAG: molybdate ABC transporter substrate-binding protein, partial [Deltaproteobacteria bacterium]|nr:molybdate ABC transporter substrate-binding protein [Deltaproteobacteria bacterium]